MHLSQSALIAIVVSLVAIILAAWAIDLTLGGRGGRLIALGIILGVGVIVLFVERHRR